MAQLKPHQQRMLDLLQVLEPGIELVTEVAVPQSSFFIDAVVTAPLECPTEGSVS